MRPHVCVCLLNDEPQQENINESSVPEVMKEKTWVINPHSLDKELFLLGNLTKAVSAVSMEATVSSVMSISANNLGREYVLLKKNVSGRRNSVCSPQISEKYLFTEFILL